MATLVKLCQEDLDTYGGPEWLLFDFDALNDLDGDRLEEIEAAVGSLMRLQFVEIPEGTGKARRAMAWLARQMAGLTEPAWNDFKIKPRRVEMKTAAEAGDGDDPLALTSSGPSSETTGTEDGSASGADTPATTTTAPTSTAGRRGRSAS